MDIINTISDVFSIVFTIYIIVYFYFEWHLSKQYEKLTNEYESMCAKYSELLKRDETVKVLCLSIIYEKAVLDEDYERASKCAELIKRYTTDHPLSYNLTNEQKK